MDFWKTADAAFQGLLVGGFFVLVGSFLFGVVALCKAVFRHIRLRDRSSTNSLLAPNSVSKQKDTHGILALIATLLIGVAIGYALGSANLYTIATSGDGRIVWRTNRLTGTVSWCAPNPNDHGRPFCRTQGE